MAAPAGGEQLASLVLQDPTLAELFQLLLEAQSGGVHETLEQQVRARAAAFSLVSTALLRQRLLGGS